VSKSKTGAGGSSILSSTSFLDTNLSNLVSKRYLRGERILFLY
jgi:hypothetical protein